MPFKSKAQARYLYAKKPRVARKFAKHTKKSEYKRLPEYVADSSPVSDDVLFENLTLDQQIDRIFNLVTSHKKRKKRS